MFKSENKEVYDLAFIGAGFSAVSCLYQINKLILPNSKKLNCIVFEPRSKIAAGIAYGTEITSQILNVPACKMSLDPDQPDSLLEWFAANKIPYQSADFIPRCTYQSYLKDKFKQVLDQRKINIQIVQQQIESVGFDNDSYCLSTSGKEIFISKKVILATGNSIIYGNKEERETLLSDPWDQQQISSAAKSSKVAIAGTGLSAVDVIVSLEKEGFAGTYDLISRRGLLPKPHLQSQTTQTDMKELIAMLRSKSNLRTKLRLFRQSVRNGNDWVFALDALRPDTAEIWASLSLSDKQRFLRHLRPYWDVHRHRIPVESHDLISQIFKNKRLNIFKARLSSAYREDETIRIVTSKGEMGDYNFVFNCMGLWTDLTKSTLIKSLVDNKLAQLDSLRMGLLTEAKGELINPQNATQTGLFTLGSLRRGSLWETTAVNEIRAQAKKIAISICSD